jgi:hypothetical protein
MFPAQTCCEGLNGAGGISKMYIVPSRIGGRCTIIRVTPQGSWSADHESTHQRTQARRFFQGGRTLPAPRCQGSAQDRASVWHAHLRSQERQGRGGKTLGRFRLSPKHCLTVSPDFALPHPIKTDRVRLGILHNEFAARSSSSRYHARLLGCGPARHGVFAGPGRIIKARVSLIYIIELT